MNIQHHTQSVSHLHSLKQKIHLNPAWQRGPVWSRPKQALLIDSILRGYDIPMLYLRERSSSATYPYEVVDGQQRLRAIWEFIEGGYPLSMDLEKIGGVSIAGKTYNVLPTRLRNTLQGFNIVIAYVKNAREPEISALFSRMQMGVRLNPAELRNAIQSGLRHAIDSTARLHPFFRNSRISPARFKHQDYLAHAISICLHKAQHDLKAPQLKRDYIEATDSNVYAPLISNANDILDLLNKVNQHAAKRITQKWIFVDLFYLLYQYRAAIFDIDPSYFADTYIQFDRERRKFNAEPEELVKGTPTQDEADLYDYIIAFKLSGAEKSNLQLRNRIMNRRFRNALEV